jgi:hypothetical protein
VRRTALLLLLATAASLLTIGLRKDWRLLHEDNGAFYTTIALTHLTAGLARTHAHDAFLDPRTGELSFYGHHPPALGLVLAGAFAATGSTGVAVARSVPIAFHLASLLVFVRLLGRLVRPGEALLGGFLLAILPLSAYFGRMVGYEPLCLFCVLVQLEAWLAYRQGARGGLFRLVLGIVLGGFVDWASFFVAGAIFTCEAIDALRGRVASRGAVVVAFASAAILALDVAHLAWACGGLTALHEVMLHQRPTDQPLELLDFLSGQLESFRRYFTHTGLIASVLSAAALVRPSSLLGRAFLASEDPALTCRYLAVTGGAALSYVAAAPSWAMVHPYWKFYFLPFTAAAMVLGLRALRVASPRWWKPVATAFALEVVVTSAYMLHLRHTRPGSYALEETARIRARWLPPPRGD